jgi:hypothetical protein
MNKNSKKNAYLVKKQLLMGPAILLLQNMVRCITKVNLKH